MWAVAKAIWAPVRPAAAKSRTMRRTKRRAPLSERSMRSTNDDALVRFFTSLADTIERVFRWKENLRMLVVHLSDGLKVALTQLLSFLSPNRTYCTPPPYPNTKRPASKSRSLCSPITVSLRPAGTGWFWSPRFMWRSQCLTLWRFDTVRRRSFFVTSPKRSRTAPRTSWPTGRRAPKRRSLNMWTF